MLRWSFGCRGTVIVKNTFAFIFVLLLPTLLKLHKLTKTGDKALHSRFYFSHRFRAGAFGFSSPG